MASKMSIFLMVVVVGLLIIGIYITISSDEIKQKIYINRLFDSAKEKNLTKYRIIGKTEKEQKETKQDLTIEKSTEITVVKTAKEQTETKKDSTIGKSTESTIAKTAKEQKETKQDLTTKKSTESTLAKTAKEKEKETKQDLTIEKSTAITIAKTAKEEQKETKQDLTIEKSTKAIKEPEEKQRNLDTASNGASFLTDDFLNNNRDGSYPSLAPCPYTHLRKTSKKPDSNQTKLGCMPHQPSKGSCNDAVRYFGSPDQKLEDRNCDETSYPDICTFTKTSNGTPELNCDAKSCGSSEVSVAAVNPSIGVITNWQPIKPFSTSEVRKFVDQKINEKHNFCFIKCGSILQALIFPPRVLTNKNDDGKNKININIVVLDSVSRPHFFRVMRDSVAAMRKVIYDESINATVLDFELFQSISMHTFGNIRSLFSGVIQGNDDFSSGSTSKKALGINVMNTEFKKHGYQTMFQEDLCWHDHWGTMLSNIKGASGKVTEKTWQDFQNIVKQHNLDHIGITHFSCQVLKKYGLTNHYDRPSKVCLNGKFYNVYFLKYLEEVFNAIRTTENSAPIFLYQHFNSAHTDSGSRIRNDDRGLVDFILNMARDPKTLTIFMSDHGHTRTGYGVTDEGRHELYHPLFFMIVPYHVADLLGKKRMEALVANQNRLFTSLDVHNALITLYDDAKKDSADYKVTGLFSKIPANRNCSDVPLMPLARCQCEGADTKVQDNSNGHRWLAEFALGSLNNIIQDQYSKGIDKNKSPVLKGFGSCVRLIGSSFSNIIQSQSGSLTTLDLHVDSKNVGLKEDEVFRVAVELKGETSAVLKSYARQTLYNKFLPCVDKAVDIKICACDKTKPKSDQAVRVLKPEEMKRLVSSPMFDSETNIKDLHGGCLFQITRHHASKITIAYEVANSCQGKTFKIAVRGSLYYVLTSRAFPFEVTVEPNSIYFLLSAVRQILNHSHMDITVSATAV